MISRRAFLSACAGGFLAAPFAAEAQQTPKVYRIAYVSPGSRGEARVLDALRQGLRERQLIEGRNLVIEQRYAEGRVRHALDRDRTSLSLIAVSLDRIDLSRGVIRLETTKSGKRREVPMRQLVYDILAPLRATAIQQLQSRDDGQVPPLVGRVWATGDIRTAFENAVAEAKLDDFHFHDCRHHFASWFVMRNGSLQALKEILGHASLAMTMRYAHLAPEHLRSEIVKTDRAIQPTKISTQGSTQEPIEPAGVSRNVS